MKRLMIVLAAVAVLAPACLWAQDPAKAEVFGGFSVQHFGGDEGETGTTATGWQSSFAVNATQRMGVVGDFGGVYKDGAKAHTYLGGLRFNHRANKMTPFAHALFGGTHISDPGGSINGFTMGFGGGMDYTATERISIRVVQFDWLPTRFSEGGISAWENNIVRFGFGIVFKTGS